MTEQMEQRSRTSPKCSVHFLLAAKEQAKSKWKPFVRIFSNGYRQEDLIAKHVAGTKDLYMVRTDIPLGQAMALVQMGKLGEWCGDVRQMDSKQYKMDVDKDCLVHLSWGQNFDKYDVSPGNKLFFFTEAPYKGPVTVLGEVKELGQWCPDEMAKQKTFMYLVKKDLWMTPIDMPSRVSIAEPLAFRLARRIPTEWGVEWEPPAQRMKHVTVPSTQQDLAVWSKWGHEGVQATAIPSCSVWQDTEAEQKAGLLLEASSVDLDGITHSAPELQVAHSQMNHVRIQTKTAKSELVSLQIQPLLYHDLPTTVPEETNELGTFVKGHMHHKSMDDSMNLLYPKFSNEFALDVQKTVSSGAVVMEPNVAKETVMPNIAEKAEKPNIAEETKKLNIAYKTEKPEFTGDLELSKYLEDYVIIEPLRELMTKKDQDNIHIQCGYLQDKTEKEPKKKLRFHVPSKEDLSAKMDSDLLDPSNFKEEKALDRKDPDHKDLGNKDLDSEQTPGTEKSVTQKVLNAALQVLVSRDVGKAHSEHDETSAMCKKTYLPYYKTRRGLRRYQSDSMDPPQSSGSYSDRTADWVMTSEDQACKGEDKNRTAKLDRPRQVKKPVCSKPDIYTNASDAWRWRHVYQQRVMLGIADIPLSELTCNYPAAAAQDKDNAKDKNETKDKDKDKEENAYTEGADTKLNVTSAQNSNIDKMDKLKALGSTPAYIGLKPERACGSLKPDAEQACSSLKPEHRDRKDQDKKWKKLNQVQSSEDSYETPERKHRCSACFLENQTDPAMRVYKNHTPVDLSRYVLDLNIRRVKKKASVRSMPDTIKCGQYAIPPPPIPTTANDDPAPGEPGAKHPAPCKSKDKKSHSSKSIYPVLHNSKAKDPAPYSSRANDSELWKQNKPGSWEAEIAIPAPSVCQSKNLTPYNLIEAKFPVSTSGDIVAADQEDVVVVSTPKKRNRLFRALKKGLGL